MNYPSNRKMATKMVERTVRTEKAEPSKPKVQKVVTGDVIRRKKPLGKRFRETFIGGEDIQSVFQYVTIEVLAPAAKDMLADAISQGAERMIFGESRNRGRRTISRAGSSYVSYNNIKGSSLIRQKEDPRPTLSRQARRSHDFDEIVLESRAEATEVIDQLFTMVDQYGQASVNDLYELVGITGEYTDETWGWTDLRGANVSRVGNGYLLNLPPTESLK